MTDNLEDYIRGTSHLYEAVREKYTTITGEVPPPPYIPLLLDKPMHDLPLPITSKMEEYQKKLIAEMELDPTEAKRYLDTALYTVFQATFMLTEDEVLFDTYCDAADSVWYNMKRDSISDLLTWIADSMK